MTITSMAELYSAIRDMQDSLRSLPARPGDPRLKVLRQLIRIRRLAQAAMNESNL